MKKIIFLLLLAVGVGNTLYAQQSALPEAESVRNTDIFITSKQGSKYNILEPVSKMQTAFGKVKAKKLVNEMDGGFSYEYLYKGLQAHFYTNHLENFKITGTEYRLVLNKQTYSVGQNIEVLKKKFPLSYKHSLAHKGLVKAFVLSIAHGKITTDAFIIIAYNEKGVITELSMRFDNC